MAEFGKSRTISDRLSEVAGSSFFGRQEELALLASAINSTDPPFLVGFIHGPGGIGKSRLIQALRQSIPAAVGWYLMDCRHIEPTPQGFLTSLGAALQMREEPVYHSVTSRLGETGQRTVLALDTYETYGLMDTWLRQEFLPSISENVFTIIAGRQAPNSAWFTAPGWQHLFRNIPLQELSVNDSKKMLESRGLTPFQVERVQRFARGYPLVLEMAAAAIRTDPDLEITVGPASKVLQQLTKAFLAGLPLDSVEAVEAASTVRRVTEPLLRALLVVPQARDAFENLQVLPFIDVTTEGLSFHDVVRDTISKDLAWRDPEHYRTYRSRAWQFFSKESHECVARNLWQCTADMLYLIENPVVREAFFPEGATDFIVEPATPDDGGAIIDIAASAEPQEAAGLIGRWWAKHPETFSVAKSRDGKVAAFYTIFEPTNVEHELLTEDPLTAAWWLHLNQNPVAQGERVLFLRRWLARATGEAPSPAQGACWLDIKRTYMELRPSLRRLYTVVTDLATYAPIVTPLYFVPLSAANVVLGGATYYSALLDFGPLSVDGWIAAIIGAELGVKPAKTEAGGRRLVTVLFTDIVGSTEKAAALGDRRWRGVLERHHALVRGEFARFQGMEIDTAGDSFLATFDSPAWAIQCACAISESVRQLGIEIRAGLHLGECEAVGDRVSGIAVHIGARVAGMAGAGEVLVSSTIRDALAGSDIQFTDHGTHLLKGIPGEWRLFKVQRGGTH